MNQEDEKIENVSEEATQETVSEQDSSKVGEAPVEASSGQEEQSVAAEEETVTEESVSDPDQTEAAQQAAKEQAVEDAAPDSDGESEGEGEIDPGDVIGEHGYPVRFEDDETYKWYVVRTYSGYEQKAKIALLERIKQNNMQEKFKDVLVPSENVIELVRGEKKTTSRKFFPGYMLVKMDLSDNTWHLVKGTPKVTGFVGNATKPPHVPPEEVAKIATQMQEGTLKPRPKVQFEEGESVRVIDGPFVNFNGVVEEVKPEKGKLRVMVSIFGRSTPVELDFVQVEKN